MEFVANGPSVPLDLLTAQEQGRLIPFCGAGVSMRAGLPNFADLANSAAQMLAADVPPDIRFELDRENYDRAMHLLERRYGAPNLRAVVREQLATPADANVGSHRAILDLGTDTSGRVRVVTTNFDTLFEVARSDLRIASAPTLPVPKLHKWDSLAYLHGRSSQEDPDGRDLVLTSGDFGVAYLVERWASRFVSELFMQGTVLFIGYRLTDPVMRYLVDAIAAELPNDSRIHQAYAFAPIENGIEDEAKWRATGIEPIFYDARDGHRALHETLEQWAADWLGGIHGKRNIVSQLGPKDPDTLPQEAIARFCWAISDESGAIARHLGEMGSAGHLGWLEVLESNHVLDVIPVPADEAVKMVDEGRTTRAAPAMSPVQVGLVPWLLAHLEEPRLLSWALRRGAHLHPQLRRRLRQRLRLKPPEDQMMAAMWSVLAGAVPLAAPWVDDRTHRAVVSEKWSPLLRRRVLNALSPCVSGLSEWDIGGRDNDEGADPWSRISFDCEVRAGASCRALATRIVERSDFHDVANDIAYSLTSLLREAMDIHAILGGASVDSDPSCIQRPTIAPSKHNHDFHGWTTLIGLTSAVFEAADPDVAARMVSIWSTQPFPVFRRLVLCSVRRAQAADPDGLLRAMSAAPSLWLWSSNVEGELFDVLPLLWDALDEHGRLRLEALIIEGIPRGEFRDDISDEDWQSLRDHSQWGRLSRLRQHGASLGVACAGLLESIEKRHPDWRLSGEDGENLPYRITSEWATAGLPGVDELRALSDTEVLDALLDRSEGPGALQPVWREFVHVERDRAIGVYELMLARGVKSAAPWSSMAAFTDVPLDGKARDRLLALLSAVPEDVLRDYSAARSMADVIWSVADGSDDAQGRALLSIWDDICEAALGFTDATIQDELMFSAINNPIGVLVRVLFRVLRSGRREGGSGVPDWLSSRLERILTARGNTARLGRVLISAQLASLHNLDPDWSSQHVVPLFRWSDQDEAICAWHGFLWSPYVSPGLWEELRGEFVLTFDHLDRIQRQLRVNLAHLLASVCLQAPDALSAHSATRCLRKLSSEGQADVARWLANQLRGAEDKAGNLWRSRIRPWLVTAWPKDVELRESTVSEELALVAVLSGDASADAMVWVATHICPGTYLGRVFKAILERRLGIEEPRAVIALLTVLVGEALPGRGGELSRVLDQVVQGEPRIVDEADFKRLREISLREG